MKTVILSSLLFFLPVLLIGQTQWKWYNPYPDGIRLNSVFQVNEHHAWAVGDLGKILVWDGQNWKRQVSPRTDDLRSVSFSDVQHGWAVGENGCILKYENGSWSDQSIPEAKNLTYIAFFGNDGWISGDTIMRLIAGEWTYQPDLDTLGISAMKFSSPGNGFALGKWQGSCCLLHFDGSNWSVRQTFDDSYKYLSFPDPQHGVLSRGEMDEDMICNYNQGTITAGIISPFVRTIFMPDSATAFASGTGGWFYVGDTRGHIFKFQNGDWSIDTIVGTPLNDIYGTDGSYWAVGESGNIYRNTDGHWRLCNGQTDNSFYHISFPDSTHGWMVANKNFIYRYANGLLEPDTILPDYYFSDVQFTDSLHGYAIANRPEATDHFHFLIYNNGIWSDHEVPCSGYVIRLKVLDANHIWVMSSLGIYFYNGEEWNTELTGISGAELKDFCMVSPTMGYALARRAYVSSILFQYDGNTWNPIRTDFPDNFERVGAFDGEKCWIVCGFGNVYRYDLLSGILTEEVANQHNYINESPDIYMHDAEEGYIRNPNGIMQYDGISWEYDNSIPGVAFISMDFSSDSYKWLCGNYGVMLSTYSQSPLSIPDNLQYSGVNYLLYPNPASANTLLEYSVSTPSRVRIDLFDTGGKLLGCLFEGNQAAGNYQLPVGDKLPGKGIYFCRILTGYDSRVVKVVYP